MPDVTSRIDLAAIEGFDRAMQQAPRVLLRELAGAFRDVAAVDAATLREQVPGRLRIRSRGLAKAIKSHGTKDADASSLSQLFGSVYFGWKASGIFETGGTIAGRGRQMTVLFPNARDATGRRTYSQVQLRQLVAARKVKFVPTPRGTLIVYQGSRTKTGKLRRHALNGQVIGILKRQVREPKRIDFFATSERNAQAHADRFESAVENTLATVAAGQ